MKVMLNDLSLTLYSIESPEVAAALIGAESINDIEIIYTLDEVMTLRSQAYAAESDPLYLSWQYDQTPEAEQAWRDKVAEIKQRYPKPA
ncbi:hypothetical protein BB427_11290 [Pseudoalteromonas sp. BMB]|uniref:hypothetical protein n=1 Tax=Pseudoalteromonas sp. BMB TaxID=1874619 RepID=UPI00083D6463|nr:hypothetical protein [Pseudoalteromonas sp. BMB]ODB41068.1 hypothetical protein BB427_11290 [Pseudoalteromonas sp. BMB]